MEEQRPLINEVHAAFAFYTLGYTVSIKSLFNILDDLDPFDRDRLLGNVYYCFGVEHGEFPTEEDMHHDAYEQFKSACEDLKILDTILVHTIVLAVLNQYKDWSDEIMADRSINTIKGFIEFCRDQGRSEEELEKWKIEAESRTVGKRSDLQVTRRLYDVFCQMVALPLMEMK